MDDPDPTMVITPFGCCVPPKMSEEIIALLRKDLPKYGPVMKFPTTKRYKFINPTIKASPAELKRAEEAKRQRLAEEAEEAATGIKRLDGIGYYSPDPTFVVDPNCPGLCHVDIYKLPPSDIPPPSFQRYLDTYQERRAAAVAALEARQAAEAARPPLPRIFIDPQMKKKKKQLMLRRKHEAAEATGTKVQAECVGSGLKRPCDDDSGTSEAHSSLEIPSPKCGGLHEDPNPTTASGQAECRGSGVKRPRDDLNPVAADDSSATGILLLEWMDPLPKLMLYRESAAATVTEGQSEREGSVLKRPHNDTNPGATDVGFEFKVMEFHA